MKVIGLTGGIASGKSTASAYLRSLGAQIVDADAISRASTRKGEAGYAAVVARFGREILRPDGEIEPAGSLARSGLCGRGARRALNALLHPIVIAACAREIERCRGAGLSACVLDVPLLFETGMERMCDVTWLLYVLPGEQIRASPRGTGWARRRPRRASTARCPWRRRCAARTAASTPPAPSRRRREKFGSYGRNWRDEEEEDRPGRQRFLRLRAPAGAGRPHVCVGARLGAPGASA